MPDACGSSFFVKGRVVKRRSREITIGGRIYGAWYRFWMKLAHRFGFCYPKPSLVDPENVWCQWCGMRGRRLIIDEVKVAAAIAQKAHDRRGEDA